MTTRYDEGTEIAQGPAPIEALTALPRYVFSWLDDLKASARARGIDLMDLGIGNPDQPTPRVVLDAIRDALYRSEHHGYPAFRGIPSFRAAAADFMRRRFGVEVDPDREVLCLSGAKEGIAQVTFAFVDESGLSLVPDVYYPVHARATGMVGGRVHSLPLRPEAGYLPDLAAVPAEALADARLLILNYPHNPTGATATVEFYEEAVEFCRRNRLVLVSDLAYSEITYDGYAAPSVLQVPGAREVAIEMHSLSKTFNMAGSRIGFAVGNADLIDALYAVRMNMGYGTPAYIQEGAVVALNRHEELAPGVVARYRERRDAVVEGFRSLGWEVDRPKASMFVWLRVPPGFTSEEWTVHLIETAGVVVTPGHAFGPGGEGFFRVSLVAEVPALRETIERLRRAGIRYPG